MAIYLKKFETQAAYEAAQSGLILPNVSLTVDNNMVHYNPSTPPTPSHNYVEIGGIKWATMNVGANSVTDTGLYFQWGDTQGYTAAQVENPSWADYKYWTSDDGSGSSGMTKYNDNDGKTVLEPSDDAVTAAWGGNWRMPTIEELDTLLNSVDYQGTDDYQGSGVSGWVCTDKTDESKVLFFPGRTVEGQEQYGYYWSSTVADGCIDSAMIWFDWWDVTIIGQYERRNGFFVRGVLDE